MPKPRRKKGTDINAEIQRWLQELRENVSLDALGLAIFFLGGYLGFALLAAEPGQTPWIAQLMGWTAPLLAGGLLLLGAVLMLGERAGYWNPEAILGGELLLLGLGTLTFLRDHASVDWTPPTGADAGGLMGRAVGALLMDALGRWPAAFLAGLLALGGAYLLVRHTPLVYLALYGKELVAPGLRQAVLGRRAPATSTTGQGAAPRPIDPAQQRPTTTPAPAAEEAPSTPQSPAPPAKSDSVPTTGKKRRPSARGAATTPYKPVRTGDALPPLDLLDADAGAYGSRNTEHMAALIQQTLADFNIPVRVVNVESGPTVTQYGVQPLYVERGGQKRKVRVSRIVNLADDLALALAAPAVRIEAPVPGHPYVGIEVPNTDKTVVGMRGILESPEMRKAGGALPLALGRDTAGAPVVMDLTRAPHLLIAGATGSGKSVSINAIITSLLMHHGPETLRFIMVDPKMVELPGYNGIPHLIGKVITDVEQVSGALTWLLLQMDDRYQLFRETGVRNIAAYNAKARKKKDMDLLPYIVLVVDELADLMMTAPEEIERQLVRLAQMSRAVGIHLVLATQRPSTDVVTGLIKANFPTRIAFAVTSLVDSRVILDKPGAERLLGQGDMLLLRPDSAKLQRVQGCWVSDQEIERVVRFWKERDAKENPDGPILKVAPWIGLMDRLDDEEELIHEAIDVIRGQETCSTSFVQRKLRIGYPRAARLMQELEAKGIVGPDLGGGQGRRVLLQEETEDEDEELLGE